MGRITHKELWKQHIAYAVTKLTQDVVQKLDQAFSIGSTIKEACDYADISPNTYYRWVEKYPELSDHFKRMRQRLPLKAKQNIAQSIQNGDTGFSRWLIERFQPEQYGDRLKLEHSGNVTNEPLHQEDEDLRLKLKEGIRANIKKRWEEKRKK